MMFKNNSNIEVYSQLIMIIRPNNHFILCMLFKKVIRIFKFKVSLIRQLRPTQFTPRFLLLSCFQMRKFWNTIAFKSCLNNAEFSFGRKIVPKWAENTKTVSELFAAAVHQKFDKNLWLTWCLLTSWLLRFKNWVLKFYDR